MLLIDLPMAHRPFFYEFPRLFRRRCFLRKRWRLLALGLLMVMLTGTVAACEDQLSRHPSPSSAAPTENCRMVEHDVGTTEVCGQPQRIAVLAPHMLDILLSLGLQPAGYAEFTTTGLGEPTTEIPVLGDRVTSQPINLGLRNTPSLETLLQLNPDLIIGEAFQQQYYDRFSQIAPTLLFAGSQKDQWQRGLRGVAQAVDRQAQAEQVIQDYQQKLAETRAAIAAVVTTYPNLLLMTAFQLPETFGVTDGQHFLGNLFEALGFQLVLPAKGNASESWFSIEVLPELQADIILVFISDHLREDAMNHIQQVWQQNPITRSLSTSQAGQVHFLEAYLFFNIRGPLAAQLILDQVQDLFAPHRE
ncbi:MAG: iron-siderophore ABC transporter substrate-binding protein [Leptolyngbya sp.]|uniref:Iron-siderophore ABC transporter substrate-binding protein n=1 Tax=Shackletoniella antarctica TaxID=268115 RepID=A0A2W4VVC6_9CYAN|nr:MAG: iron-siderophore ABC transporter substrate-binding protein [Shackletoniella antarctica]PZV20749.1 MAG: iron-siderophore ABC transporter substrate-binding protein [Leptolyngbya sp.]